MRPVVTLSAGALALAISLGITACGSSSTQTITPGSGTTAATSTTGPTATTGLTPTTATTATAITAPGGAGGSAFSTGPVPAVTGGTDLAQAPTLAAGGGAPPTQLTGQDLVTGTGPAASDTSTVTVQYVGALYDTGKVFDASWPPTGKGPTSFPLSQVIPGFKNTITGMKIGGRREVVIPPSLAYGAAGRPPTIPPSSTLVFVIDLLGVS